MPPATPCPAYPTFEHRRAAEAVVEAFRGLPAAEGVILTRSCARGKATKDSCVDIVVLAADAPARAALAESWERAYRSDPAYAALRAAGRFSHVDLDITDGRFEELTRLTGARARGEHGGGRTGGRR